MDNEFEVLEQEAAFEYDPELDTQQHMSEYDEDFLADPGIVDLNKYLEENKKMASASVFKIRRTKPSKEYKFISYYIKNTTTLNGIKGKSYCVLGNPKDSAANVLSNCVGYACGRFNEIYSDIMGTTSMKYPLLCNDAEQFISYCVNKRHPELKPYVSQEPEVGAIVVQEGLGTRAGHVFIVEDIISPSKLLISEACYGGTSFRLREITKTKAWDGTVGWGNTSTLKFLGFIHNPAMEHAIIADPSVEKDETKDQILAHSDSLRIRDAASLSANILGFTKSNHYYNYFEIKNADGYDWYRIGTDMWCAKTGSFEVLPKSKEYRKPQIGDTVILNGPIYKSSMATSPSNTISNRSTKVTRFAEGTLHPYNTTGDLGWCDAVSLTLVGVEPQPIAKEHNISIEQNDYCTIEIEKDKANPGEPIGILVKAKEGYKVEAIKCNNKILSENSFIMPNSDVVISVELEKVEYSISVSISGRGVVECKNTATVDENIVITATPDKHYQLKEIICNGIRINDLSFIMPAKDVLLECSFEEVVKPIFNVGDNVKILAAGNTKPDGSGSTVFQIGNVRTISNIIWVKEFQLAEYCYELSAWDGTVLGYYKESELELNVPIVKKEFDIGETIVIASKGNSKSDGSGFTTYGIGWKKEVLDYIEGAEYPYEIGRSGVIQGYYKAIGLKKYGK